jgi:hypothetical protein
MARLQGNASRQQDAYDRWSRCPDCGSISVRTINQSSFRSNTPPNPPPAVSMNGTISCPCGQVLPDDAKFCLNCGAPAARVCSCGTQLQVGARFCSNCGAAAQLSTTDRRPPPATPVNTPQPNPSPPPSRDGSIDDGPAELQRTSAMGLGARLRESWDGTERPGQTLPPPQAAPPVADLEGPLTVRISIPNGMTPLQWHKARLHAAKKRKDKDAVTRLKSAELQRRGKLSFRDNWREETELGGFDVANAITTVEVQCPSCRTVIAIFDEGLWNCPHCSTQFSVTTTT